MRKHTQMQVLCVKGSEILKHHFTFDKTFFERFFLKMSTSSLLASAATSSGDSTPANRNVNENDDDQSLPPKPIAVAPTPADVENLLWKCVMDADRQSNRDAVTSTVFTYLLNRLKTVPNLTTGEAIVDLEKRFRKTKANTWCIARKTTLPYVSCNFRKEPTQYHLYLVVDTKARAKKQLAKNGWSNAAQNQLFLQQCGFLENAEEAAIKEKRMQAVRLPNDLEHVESEHNAIFDADSARYYAENEKEADEILQKCQVHSECAKRGQYSEILSFTGVQVARTSVPIDVWNTTAQALYKQMTNRLPIAESTEQNKNTQRKDNVRCVREQLIPIGYQLLGYTTREELLERKSDDNDDDGGDDDKDREDDGKNSSAAQKVSQTKFALFDFYAVTERKYHVEFSDKDYEWWSDIVQRREHESEKNVKQLQALLLEKTGVADAKEMSGINFENVRRHVHLLNRGPTPLDLRSFLT